MQIFFLRVGIVVALIFPGLATAAEHNELAELKQLLEQMKQEYEARIGALEARIKDVQQQSKAALSHANPSLQVMPEARQRPVEQRGDNAFNPAISLVLQGSTASYSQDPEHWTLPGFQVGGEAGLKPEGLSMTETELTASANVDDWFFAQATLGLHEAEDGTEVDLEEAFVDSLSLPAGLGLRFGRFYSEVGYLNSRHTHAWDFADAPLTHQAFLGYQYGDDGLRLTWLAPSDRYLELGVEALRGETFPASGDGGELLGDAHNYFVRLGDDLGSSHNFRVGLSHLRMQPADRYSGHVHAGHSDEVFSFAGDSDLTVLDLVWKWAPNGNASRRSFVFQTEYFYRDEVGEVGFTNDTGDALLSYDGNQRGIYAQGIYQFIPRWRVGLRYDRLWSGNNLGVLDNASGESDEALLEESGLLSLQDPWRWTLMADYSHSEFSRLRLQYAQDHSRPDRTDDQILLQYIMTLGAHGAHQY